VTQTDIVEAFKLQYSIFNANEAFAVSAQTQCSAHIRYFRLNRGGEITSDQLRFTELLQELGHPLGAVLSSYYLGTLRHDG
jgi:hypothetical protein